MLKNDPSKFVPGRSRRQEKLPYSMHLLTENEKNCDLCGPPFPSFTPQDIRGISVCSYNCVKRFVNEVLAKPKGFQIIQGKTKREASGRPSILHSVVADDRSSISNVRAPM